MISRRNAISGQMINCKKWRKRGGKVNFSSVVRSFLFGKAKEALRREDGNSGACVSG